MWMSVPPPSLLPPFLITRLPPRKYCSSLPSPGIFMGHARLRLRGGRGGDPLSPKPVWPPQGRDATAERQNEGRRRHIAVSNNDAGERAHRVSLQQSTPPPMVCQKGGRQNWIPGRHVMHPILAQVDQVREQTQTQPAAQSMRMPEGNWNMPSTTHTLPTSLVPVSAYIHTRSWRWRRLRRIVRRRRRRAEARERQIAAPQSIIRH